MPAKTTPKQDKSVTIEKPRPIRTITIDKNEEFLVRPNIIGPLYFKSTDSTLEFALNDPTDSIYLTFEDLMKIKRTSIKFFSKNWIIIVDNDKHTASEAYCALKVDQYYKSCYASPETLDALFKLPPEQIASQLQLMTPGYKETVAARAKELINSGEIDSRRTISALSTLLKINLEDE